MKPSFSYGVKAPEQVKAFFESLTAEWRAEKEESTKLESFELQNQILTKELADTLDFTDDISQYITCTLPEGTWLGEYEPYVIDVYKGSKILGDFEKYDHSECEADTWCSLCAPGGIGAAPNVAQGGYDIMEFQDGKPVSIHWYSNHSSFRKVGTYQDDFAMPALLYEIEMDLFTVATAEKYAAAHNLKVEDLTLTAEFWFVFFGEEDSDLVYTVYLNQEYFSKEDVIKLAESIQIIPQTSVRVQESSAEETHKIMDYLAAYAVDSYENEYIKLDAVEGLSYVVGVNGISIYNQDYYCGWFGTRDFMQVKLREDWQDALQLEYILDSMGLGKSGYVELLDYQTTDNVERYVYEGGIRPFDYADREWLVGSGIFASEKSADEEVCVEAVVLFCAAHMDKGYSFSLNQTLVTEGKLWKLVDAVSFKENAFTAVNAGEIHFSEETVPSMYSVGPEVIQREFAKSLAYDIQVGTLTYHVPEHTVALKSRELTWELYAYDGSDGRWVGTVYAGPTLEVEKAAGEAGSHRRQKKYVRFKWCQEKIYPGNSDVKRRHGDDKSIHGRFGLIV